MSLYLCIFASDDVDDEIDGFDAGSYTDWAALRDTIVDRCENGVAGSRFPVLTGSPDSGIEWSPLQCAQLRDELVPVITELQAQPCGVYPVDSWQQKVADDLGLTPATLADWFINLDGEPLLAALYYLTGIAISRQRAISLM